MVRTLNHREEKQPNCTDKESKYCNFEDKKIKLKNNSQKKFFDIWIHFFRTFKFSNMDRNSFFWWGFCLL